VVLESQRNRKRGSKGKGRTSKNERQAAVKKPSAQRLKGGEGRRRQKGEKRGRCLPRESLLSWRLQKRGLTREKKGKIKNN